MFLFNLPGTSDPYVKFKADGKQIYKSRTIPKNLNPQWNEKFCVPIEDISMPLVIKVFDFDRVSSDDPMGTVTVDLAQMEVNRLVVFMLDASDFLLQELL
jgi:Ca2+-dependent lipid-binding protein